MKMQIRMIYETLPYAKKRSYQKRNKYKWFKKEIPLKKKSKYYSKEKKRSE